MVSPSLGGSNVAVIWNMPIQRLLHSERYGTVMSRLAISCCAFLLACSLKADSIVFNSTEQDYSSNQSINIDGDVNDLGSPVYAEFSTRANSSALSDLWLVLGGTDLTG